jgi:hypothetical protein
MFDKSHFGRIVNFFINIALGIALVFEGLLFADNLQPMVFVQSFVVSMGIGYTICDLIPAPIWGERLARKLKIQNRFLFHLVSTAAGGIILVPCISFFCQFVALGSMIFHVWPHILLFLILTGYAVLLVFLPICKKLAVALTK